MEKNGKVGMPCTYCQKPAIKDTFPPVCEDHRMRKDASVGTPRTLRELEVSGAESRAPEGKDADDVKHGRN